MDSSRVLVLMLAMAVSVVTTWVVVAVTITSNIEADCQKLGGTRINSKPYECRPK